MAQQVGFFEYVRQKFFVLLIRAIVPFLTFPNERRDNRLCKASYSPNVQTIRIPSRDKNRTIKAHLYAPPSPSTAPTPILVNWHGSGFIIPMLGMDALYAARIAKEAGIYVLDTDYRKAPESRFPGAVEDVEDVLAWVGAQPERFHTERVGVSGFSAGGNLALVAASALRKTLAVGIKVVVSVYPVTDWSIASAAKTVPHPVRPFNPGMLDLFADCYVPDKGLRRDPRVSPAYAKPEEYPEMVVIVTAQGDVLAPEADELARKLDDGSRKVVHCMVPNMHHGYEKGCKEGSKEWEEREKSYALIVKKVKESLAG